MPNFITWSPLRFAATPFLEILKTPPISKTEFHLQFLIVIIMNRISFLLQDTK